MRVLCVTNLFPNRFQPNRGVYNWKHFLTLQQHAALRVVAPILWTDELSARRHGYRGLVTEVLQEWNGVPVVYPRYYYTPSCFRGNYGAFMKMSIARAFRQAVAEFRPDVIYGTWAYPDGWAACRLAREFNLPVVVKVHGSDLFLLDDYPGRGPGTAEAMQNADAIVGVGQALCDAAVKLGAHADRCHVVHEGTDTQLFCPGDQAEARRGLQLPPDLPRLLFVGNLVAVKRIDNLIAACRRLRDDGLAVEADIIGEGPLKGALQRPIDEAGLTHCIHLRGRMTPGELPAWYRAADVFVLPSDSEGVPNVLVEAAACGTPFVATAVGCIPEIAHFVRSQLVPPNDAAALARGIRALLVECAPTTRMYDVANVPSVSDGVEATMRVFSQVLAARRDRSHQPASSATPLGAEA